MTRLFTAVASVLTLVGLVACGSSGGGGSVPLPNPPATPAAHLYLPGGSGNSLNVFTAPFTSASVASTTISNATLTSAYGTLLDAAGNRLFVGVQNGVAVYPLPITSASTPSFVIPIAGSFNAQMALDTSGNLYVADRLGALRVFAPPFSAASTPTAVHTGYSNVFGVTISNGTLYVSDDGSNTVYAYALPFTSASTPAVSLLPAASGLTGPFGITIDPSGRLVVADSSGIAVFTLPLTASSTPAFKLTAGISSPTCASFDATGQMYVSNFGSNTIAIYNAGLTAASTAATTFSVGAVTPYCQSVGI